MMIGAPPGRRIQVWENDEGGCGSAMFARMMQVRVIENIRRGDSKCQRYEHKLPNVPGDWIHRSAAECRGSYSVVLVAMKMKGHYTMPIRRCHLSPLALREGMIQSAPEDSRDCAEMKTNMYSSRCMCETAMVRYWG